MEVMSILQVVGYKNSGKTTLLEHWIKKLRHAGQEIAVIKHHGHQEGLELPNEQTDSMKLFCAGAICSLATDGKILQLHQRKTAWSLDDMVEMAKISHPNTILIEGFKEAPYPKVVLVKSIEDWETLSLLENIVCVITHQDLELTYLNTMKLANLRQLDDWLFHWLGGTI